MTKLTKADRSVIRGLEQAAAHMRGEDVPGMKIYIPAEIDVKAIRANTGLTQEQFATAFDFKVGTVRDWEQGRFVPDGAARSLLKLIAAHPGYVRAVLKGGPGETLKAAWFQAGIQTAVGRDVDIHSIGLDDHRMQPFGAAKKKPPTAKAKPKPKAKQIVAKAKAKPAVKARHA